MEYDEFFGLISTGEAPSGGVPSTAPYAYQRQLASGGWPDMLHIPTGLGKTIAITGAWLYRRLTGDSLAPRRMVWCLPMRVLVEQTRANVETWLNRAAPLFEQRGLVAPRAWVLMGGEVTADWVDRPEDPAVLIGTQDMLLSRGLMRGYGMSRYRWPVDFALLHNDALWVFDEVQLMGAGLATSAQLDAFRRDPAMQTTLPSRTIWSSATLRSDWFDTVDFRKHAAGCRVLRLAEADRRDTRVEKRISAMKQLAPAGARLDAARKVDMKAYVDSVAAEVADAHEGDAPTLVILNRVARAQDIHSGLSKRLRQTGARTDVVLVHARFRAAERAALNRKLRDIALDGDVIIVATQAVEAGIDMTSRRLFTELAPWASLVQRFGRCNRGGEYHDARVSWIDIDSGAAGDLALPYTAAELARAREVLQGLDSASASNLPPVTDSYRASHVLRRKDLLDLFNTEPDLSGFDIDISPYLRDAGGADVHLFWRDLGDRPEDEPRPERSELCAVPIGTAKAHLRSVKRRAYAWNTLEAEWRLLDGDDLHPGQVLMMDADAGGYDPELGFVAGLRDRVEPVRSAIGQAHPDAMEDDQVEAGTFVALADHLREAERQAAALIDALPITDGGAVRRAALWHDVGKAHPAFQTALLERADDEVDRSQLWAKSANARGRLRYGFTVDGAFQSRRHFRHELASMLAWLEVGLSKGCDDAEPNADDDGDRDLNAYLIAAHHGKVRTALRALPKETSPPDGRLFARGVWAGDTLPAVAVNGLRLPPLTLRLDVMQLGGSEMGPSWSARTARLLEQYGPFRLAWLETMVRLADWRASEPRSALSAGRFAAASSHEASDA